MTDANLIEIFCILDEFCKYFTPELKKHTLDTCGKRRRNRPCRMSDSEVMTILVLFHTMRHRDLKSFYLGYVCNHMRREFPNRFVKAVNDELYNVCQIEHTRHRCIDNFTSNLVAGLIAYNLLPKKPSLNIDIIDKSRLIA